MICANCRGENPAGVTACVHCGRELLSATSAPTQASDNLVATVIPYKNMPALIAYYLGVFSVIPCIGLPLGIAAVVLGIMGIRRAAAHPESKGKVHAWVGIIAGGLFALIYLALAILLLMGPILAAMLHRGD